MTGITGVYSPDPWAGRRAVTLMNLLGPRAGQPGSQCHEWTAAGAASAGQGSSLSRDGDVLVVADARLDDLPDIAGSPAAVILQAYRRWGDACVQHLSGDYAFAVVTPDCLFCARDPIGSKPFYYCSQAGEVSFASEGQAIGRSLGLAINRERVADSLVFPLEHVDKTSTFFGSVVRLPPGSTLTADRDGIRIRTFWRAVADVREDADLDEVTAEFTALLERSVQSRVAGHAVSLSLSGGVDSGTILGFAGSDVLAVSTLSPESAACEDSRFIRLLVDHYGCDTSFCRSEDIPTFNSSLLNQLENIAEPFDYYMLVSMLVSSLSAAAGRTVQLDGVEGDLTYSLGPNYPAGLMREGHVWQSLLEARGVHEHEFAGEGSLLLWYLNCLRQVGLPRRLGFLKRLRRRFFRRTLSDPDQTLIHPDLARETRVQERLDALSASLHGGYPDLTEKHRRNLEHPALVAALERYDRVASWHGVEPRHPLMDLSLFSLMLSLPWHMKSRDGRSKILLRRAGAGRVPDVVRWRMDKDENGWRFLEAFLALNRNYLRETVLSETERLRDFVHPDRLRMAGDEDLLQLFVLAHWLRNVNARESAASAGPC